MKNIMQKAWEIAKTGQEKFGGKVKEYFAQALKMAWAVAKKAEVAAEVATATIVTSCGSKKLKAYVAKIVGKDARWGLQRSFLTPQCESEWDDKTFTFELNEGDVYEIQAAKYDVDRHYRIVENGELTYISPDSVKTMFA